VQRYNGCSSCLQPYTHPSPTTFINNTHSTPSGPALTYPSYVGTRKNQSSSSPLPTRAAHAPPCIHRNAWTQFQLLSCICWSASHDFGLSPTLLFRLLFRCIYYICTCILFLFFTKLVIIVFYFCLIIYLFLF